MKFAAQATFTAALSVLGAVPVAAMTVHLAPVVSGFSGGFVVDVTPVPGTADKMFLTDFTAGMVTVLDRTSGSISPFLPGVTIDGTPIGDTFFESAAFALATAPDFEKSGKFYVSVNTTKTQNVVVEYTADPKTLTVDPSTQRRVVTIEHPKYDSAEIHYGGAISFGPDGMLYMTTGDVGAPFGPGSDNPAQDESNRLGAVLRIDLSGDDYPGDPENNYAVPPGNPDFGPGSDPALIASGLRNPFKAEFDPATGILYIGEVGQLQRDEIDIIDAGPLKARNFGWPAYEGTLPLTAGYSLDGLLTDPVHEVVHGTGAFEGFSVTGGTVYRGPIEALQGLYFFGDFGPGDPAFQSPLWSFRLDPAAGTISQLVSWGIDIPGAGALGPVLGFGTDGLGNLFVSDANGSVYQFVAATIPLPAPGLLLAGGLIAFGTLRRRRQSPRGTPVPAHT